MTYSNEQDLLKSQTLEYFVRSEDLRVANSPIEL